MERVVSLQPKLLLLVLVNKGSCPSVDDLNSSGTRVRDAYYQYEDF